MGVLSSKQRQHLAPNQFALSGGRFPINDAPHARNALARVEQSLNAGNISKAEHDIVVRKANAFLDAHTSRDSHADGVKS